MSPRLFAAKSSSSADAGDVPQRLHASRSRRARGNGRLLHNSHADPLNRRTAALAADPDPDARSHGYRVLNRESHARIHDMAASPIISEIMIRRRDNPHHCDVPRSACCAPPSASGAQHSDDCRRSPLIRDPSCRRLLAAEVQRDVAQSAGVSHLRRTGSAERQPEREQLQRGRGDLGRVVGDEPP